MKTLIPILAILALSSCKKCYQCTMISTMLYDTTRVQTVEFCGTKKEKDRYEWLTSVTIASNGETSTKCR